MDYQDPKRQGNPPPNQPPGGPQGGNAPRQDGPMSKKPLDPDLNIYTLGLELTNLGLNLTDSEKVYPHFGSPFSDDPTRKTDPYNLQLPGCYLKISSNLNEQYLKKFPIEPLIYIFCHYKDDTMRVNAAIELYSRGYKYHYPTETWISDQVDPQTGFRKYFNTSIWGMKNLNQDVNESELLTVDDFKKALPTTTTSTSGEEKSN